MFSIIAVVGNNNDMGKKNALIWNILEDLKYFRKTTLNHKVVMGRKTFESIGKALPKRENFVVTFHEINIPDVYVISNLEKFICENKNTNEEIFIRGGRSIYNKFLQYSNKIYLTEIDQEYKEADSYFPNFDKSLYIKTTNSSESIDSIRYVFNVYVKN